MPHDKHPFFLKVTQNVIRVQLIFGQLRSLFSVSVLRYTPGHFEMVSMSSFHASLSVDSILDSVLILSKCLFGGLSPEIDSTVTLTHALQCGVVSLPLQSDSKQEKSTFRPKSNEDLNAGPARRLIKSKHPAMLKVSQALALVH
jgi:hypothetical protein